MCHVENFNWPTLNFDFSVSLIVLCLFLAVPWAGLWFVIAALSGQTHFFFTLNYLKTMWISRKSNLANVN